MTINHLVEHYEPEILTRNTKSASEYRRQGELWRTELGTRQAAAVTAGEIERWKARRLETHAPATVNLSLRYLKMLFNLALRDDLVEKNPLARGRVKEVREDNQRERILTPEEEAVLAEHLPRALWLKVVVALYTGMRQSEQFGLLRKHVDLAKRLVCLVNAKGSRRGEKQWVRLNTIALAALTEVMDEESGQWVWTARHGQGPVDGTSVLKRLQRACRKLGIEGMTSMPCGTPSLAGSA